MERLQKADVSADDSAAATVDEPSLGEKILLVAREAFCPALIWRRMIPLDSISASPPPIDASPMGSCKATPSLVMPTTHIGRHKRRNNKLNFIIRICSDVQHSTLTRALILISSCCNSFLGHLSVNRLQYKNPYTILQTLFRGNDINPFIRKAKYFRYQVENDKMYLLSRRKTSTGNKRELQKIENDR